MHYDFSHYYQQFLLLTKRLNINIYMLYIHMLLVHKIKEIYFSEAAPQITEIPRKFVGHKIHRKSICNI